MDNIIFMSFILVIGLLITGISWRIDDDTIKYNCNNKTLKSANKGVFIVGLICLFSAVSYGVFGLNNCKCDSIIGKIGGNVDLYSIFIFLLGFVLLGLGITIHQNSKDKCDKVKNGYLIILIGLSLIFGSGINLWAKMKNNKVAPTNT
jgi:MFS family permease